MYPLWFGSSIVHARCTLAFVALLAGCASKTEAGSEDSATDDRVDSVASFEEALIEVMVPSCGFDSCHGSGAGFLRIHDAQTEDEWLDMESAVIAGRKLITPGAAGQSYLIEKMEGAPSIQGDVMPPSGSISSDRIGIVRSWIDNIE